MIRVTKLDAADGEAWAKLFGACSSACFCRYWHFEGNKNEWLDRCAHDADANRREQLLHVLAGNPCARGLIAWQGDLAVGWMKLTPRAALGKLTRLPVYRGLDAGADEGVFGIGCLLVLPDQRRRGVARALVLAADAHVRAWGGVAIEAYPRHAEGPLHDEEAWMGPEGIFREAGYEVDRGSNPYPVYRKALGPPA